MNLLENISLAINGLISNKMRALLTMLGIIIGIGSSSPSPPSATR